MIPKSNDIYKLLTNDVNDSQSLSNVSSISVDDLKRNSNILENGQIAENQPYNPVHHSVWRTDPNRDDVIDHSILYGVYEDICNNHLLKFEIQDTTQAVYVYYDKEGYPMFMNKTEVEKLPFLAKYLQLRILYKFHTNLENILKLQVIPIPDDNMKVLLVKIVMRNEFNGQYELTMAWD